MVAKKRRTAEQKRATANANLKRRYGINKDDYDAMLEAQGGGCYICGMRPKSKNLHVDHDHRLEVNGKAGPLSVRGLLCLRCNRFLAQIRDDPDKAARAVTYLNDPPGLPVEPVSEVEGPTDRG